MRIGFLLAVLALGLFYSYYAFVDLPFLTMTGRLGPGFFPRLIGTGILLFTTLSLVLELRRKTPDGAEATGGYGGSVATMVGLGFGYLVALYVFGGVLATILFLFACLSILNRGRLVVNVVIALFLPIGVYLLFVVVLNASMPRGLLALPF